MSLHLVLRLCGRRGAVDGGSRASLVGSVGSLRIPLLIQLKRRDTILVIVFFVRILRHLLPDRLLEVIQVRGEVHGFELAMLGVLP